MPPISRYGDWTNTGHICAKTTSLARPSQNTVYAQGKAIARQMDLTVKHPFPPKPPCLPHVAVVMNGSRTVIVSGMLCARIGDPVDMAMRGLFTGAYTVWAGG